MKLLFWVPAILLFACSADPSIDDVGGEPDAAPDLGVGGAVMDHQAWTAVAAADDPFEDRPDTIDCERGVGWDVEVLDVDETIGVETGNCNYLGLVQPLRRAVSTGETLAVQLWHFQLEGGGPAHAAVAVDGEIVWEITISIPSDSGLIYEEFEVPSGAAAGAQLVFHLHNHGLNSWNLVAVREPDP